MTDNAQIIDVTTEQFEAQVLQQSLQTPVLVDFWATWCEPCKTLGPILEKLAIEYNGAFILAKIDVDKEQQIAAAFQIRSVPTVYLVKDGQPIDGFPGVISETQIRELLQKHGITPAVADEQDASIAAPVDPHTQVIELRKAVEAEPSNDALKLDLALALLKIGADVEAQTLIEALPANLATDDRTIKAKARLGFINLLKSAPPVEVLETAINTDPSDLRARHLLGVQHLLAGQEQAALEQFLEMLRRDRSFDNGLPRTALIDAFRIIEDQALVSQYRRKMSSLLF